MAQINFTLFKPRLLKTTNSKFIQGDTYLIHFNKNTIKQSIEWMTTNKMVES